MNIFKEIQKLEFPVNEYVIVGGGSMMARGIKETYDIDIVVTENLFNLCKDNGWQGHPKPNGDPSLRRENVELYLDVNCGDFNPTFEELRNRAEIINNIPFCSLEDVIDFKKRYNRDKDIKDINLIKEYLGVS